MPDAGWSAGLIAQLTSAGAVGGLVTWLGTEISRRVTMAREKREHTARALAELLEIRRYISVFKILKEELEKAVGTSIPNLMPAMHAILPQFIPLDWAGLAKRYNDAVSALASLQPVLAYQLRSKDAVVPFMQRFGAGALQNADIAKAWPMIDQLVGGYGLSALTDSVLMLAQKHGWRTWWRAKKVLKEQDKIPSELQTTLFDWIKQASTQPAPAPQSVRQDHSEEQAAGHSHGHEHREGM